MADILRRVALLAINRASCGKLHMPIRTVFSSSGIGIDNFKLSRDQHASRYAPSLDAFKKRFVDSIEEPNSQIFTEDLRNMIMSADNDQEIDIVIQALKKYSTNKVKFSDYHFGSPIMRLLYIQNKTDLALELYMNEDLKNIFNDSASALVLMNKLIEEKRYDDAIKVFEHGSKRGFSTTSGRTYPSDVVMLAIEGLFRKNTKEALVKAKEIISKVRERDSDINPRTAAMVALLAIQQGEPSFAMEILGAVRVQNYTMIKNIRAICYADMERVEEAINVVQLLAEQTPVSADRRRVFPLVMRHIRLAAEKLNDPNLLTRFEELSKMVLKNNRLSTTDLPEFLGEPINRRGPARQGTQRNILGNFQRNVGEFRNRGEFNQQSNNFRQGNTGGFNRSFGGFNRDNRFGYNNFQRQDLSYERRSQNAFGDGYQRNNENDRFPTRNRSSSLNEYSRQEGRNQQQYQSFSRLNRSDSGSSPTRRFGNPNTSESKRNTENDLNLKQTKPKRPSNEDTQTQEQSPWERSTRH
ncbi:unnamed protein product [Rotaria sp. Silwood1]|nr:unnamed protein product [Rotaria sp. Silwood1]CAF0747159.1 unnamed protein product [Rotaria sp. Silwood1]CAF3328750.1 unnamed protein product [Rotaria sp. Silwood1]CAF3348097.1 unnamed protein product [Rotaria sp. Silwood1]CAF3352109.1 unnamed protein product [Rotaria sp. Silwood1]